MTTPNIPASTQRSWTPDDLGVFVKQIQDDRFLALWMLVATTGMQLDAVTSLERHDVDFEARQINPQPSAVSGGFSVQRSYGLDPTTYDALKEHVIAWDKERGVLRQDTQKLFVWSNGEQVDDRAVRLMFSQHCVSAGLPRVPLQEVRQTYVVAALETGIPVKVISERVGHNVDPQSLWGLASANRRCPADLASPQRRSEHSRERSQTWRSRSF